MPFLQGGTTLKKIKCSLISKFDKTEQEREHAMFGFSRKVTILLLSNIVMVSHIHFPVNGNILVFI